MHTLRSVIDNCFVVAAKTCFALSEGLRVNMSNLAYFYTVDHVLLVAVPLTLF